MTGRGGRHRLGEGLWRADFDRIDRGARRVLQVVASRERRTGAEAAELAEVVELVRTARELAWQCCVTCYERAPGASSEVPADEVLARAHRGLSRAATAAAQVAQAVVIGDEDGAAARRAASTLLHHTTEAATALAPP